MLKILVQWIIQHKILNHLSQCQLGVRLDLYKKCGSNSVLLRWQRSISDANCTFLSSFHASANSSFLFLTFVSCHTGIFSSCSHYVFHCSLCGILNDWSIGINLCTGLWRLNEFIPFPAMWSSWHLWGAFVSSTIQAYSVLFSPMARKVSLLLRHREVLRGIAADIGTSNFLRALFMISWNSSASGSMK